MTTLPWTTDRSPELYKLALEDSSQAGAPGGSEETRGFVHTADQLRELDLSHKLHDPTTMPDIVNDGVLVDPATYEWCSVDRTRLHVGSAASQGRELAMAGIPFS